MLHIRQLSKTYPGGVAALHLTDLTVEAGERLVLLGPSGSGKSTLLRLIVGLEESSGGEVWWEGQRIDRLPAHQRGVAFLPQRPALYPHLTVKQNLAEALPRKTQTQGSRSAFSLEDGIDLLRLGSRLDRYPHQLSGGEKQRVALGKVLLRGCRLWLLDEPFAGLDPPFRAEFRHDLHLLSTQALATIIIVSHDPIDASALGRRLGVLGNGVLQQVGTPDELRTLPNNRFVAFALGQFCFLDGTADHGELAVPGTNLRIPLPPGLRDRLVDQPATRRLAVGLRPDDGQPDSSGNIGWIVQAREPSGSAWLLTLTQGRARIVLEWREEHPPTVGDSCPWAIRPGQGLWFDGETGARL